MQNILLSVLLIWIHVVFVKGSEETEAEKWVLNVEEQLQEAKVEYMQFHWARITNLTNTTAKRLDHESKVKYKKLKKTLLRDIPKIDEAKDENTRRKLEILHRSGGSIKDDGLMRRSSKILSEMIEITSKTEVEGIGDGRKISKKMKKIGDESELKHAWKSYNDAVGQKVKPLFEEFVKLQDQGAKDWGFKDTAERWRSKYDMPEENVEEWIDGLWEKIEPLYLSLHCYVARKLREKYGSEVAPEFSFDDDKSGGIAAHVLGNLQAQDWTHTFSLVAPDPKSHGVHKEINKQMKKKKWKALDLHKNGEEFYKSMGFGPLPDSFWKESMFVKNKTAKPICHASATDFGNGDIRVKMCTKVNAKSLETIYHEYGHLYYYHEYKDQPLFFRRGALDAMHEAVGDTILKSATPSYWKKVGLLPEDFEEHPMNYLMLIALRRIAFLPFGLLVDKWRWEVFDGTVEPSKYNSRWWELRWKYQKIFSPVERSDDTDFDPGSKYHIAANKPYLKYFLAYILQFQLHKALCDKTNFKGALHECSNYESEEAGEAFREMLQLGRSKPWQDALETLTSTREISAEPLLEYFQPLLDFLQEENKGEQCFPKAALHGTQSLFAAKLHPHDWIYIAGPAVLVLILVVTYCSHYEATGDKYPLLKDWETAI